MRSGTRKIILFMTAVMLTNGLFYCHQCGAETEYISLVTDKYTEYHVVSYLQNAEQVLELTAQLKRRTMADFAVSDDAGGKVIRIGTDEQLREPG